MNKLDKYINQTSLFTQTDFIGQVELQVIIAPRMPVIQLWQPWASWVMEGWKTIETRTHNNFVWMLNYKVAVHACGKWHKEAIEIARPYLTNEQIRKTEEFKSIRKKIIGTAIVEKYSRLNSEHSKRALIECENTKRYGLFLKDITKIEPIKFIGAQRQLYIDEAQL